MASHFRFSSLLLYTPHPQPNPTPLLLIFFLSLLFFPPFSVLFSCSPVMDWLFSGGSGPRCCGVADRGTCTDGRGTRGWGWRVEAWICMCGLISLLPPPILHGKIGEHGAGSVGGGSNNIDWNIAMGWWSCELFPHCFKPWVLYLCLWF